MTGLSSNERLKLQQLRLREWVGHSTEQAERAEADESESSTSSEPDGLEAACVPSEWEMTRGIDLHSWQESACDAWFSSGQNGIIKVVTGAGKTIVALSIIERLQRSDPELRVAIVVPTIVLMNQWRDAILEHSNLPERSIGRMGGGQSDDFSDTTRILIAVLASARKKLPQLVDEDMSQHLLLVGDECHRVKAPEMSRVLNTLRTYSLGLSATPERADGDDDATAASAASERADQGLGSIVYEMNFAQAVEFGVLPPFEVEHFGLPLDSSERQQYDKLSKSIRDARKELCNSSPTALKKADGAKLLPWAILVAAKGGELAGLASRFVGDTSQRKQLLYKAQSRRDAVLALVQQTLASRNDARIILFHESINEVVNLFELLASEGVPAVMEHSRLPSELRDTSLELFRNGIAQVVVSARSLIEGFNVPEADLGIIVASSSSPRQRIQSIGRVLRRHQSSDGGEKASRICILYVRDTVDESIYERQDWDKMIGLDRNRFYKWDLPEDAVQQDGPPRAVIPDEGDIDITGLNFGDEWPGRYDGEEYSCDKHDNVLTLDKRFAVNPQGVSGILSELKGGPGKFKVTPKQQVILVRIQGDTGNWITKFGGCLEQPFDFAVAEQADSVDVSGLHPGDQYRGPLEPAEELKFRQKQGGVVAKKHRGGEFFASGDRAERLVEVLQGIRRTNSQVSKFFVNELGHAFWRERGEARFIASDAGGLFSSKNSLL